MEYPKKIMSIAELAALGHNKDYLRQLAHMREFGRGYGFRLSNARNGKIYFYTDSLDELIGIEQKRAGLLPR